MTLSSRSEGVDLGVEGQRGHRIVGLAAEPEPVDEEVFDVIGHLSMAQAAHSSSVSSSSAGRRPKPMRRVRAARGITRASSRP